MEALVSKKGLSEQVGLPPFINLEPPLTVPHPPVAGGLSDTTGREEGSC